MPGRGRPRTAESRETKRPNGTSAPRKRETLVEEKRPTTAAKKKEQQNHKLPEDNATEVTKKTPKDTPSKKSAKECSGRATSPEMTKQSARATSPLPQVQPRATSPLPQVQPRATSPLPQVQPRATSPLPEEQPSMHERKKYTAMGARPKTCGVRARSPVEETEDIMDSKPQNGRKGRKPGVKARGERAKSPAGEMALQVRQLSLDDNQNVDAAKKAEVNAVLSATLDKLKIRKIEKSKAAKTINEIQKVILEHLKSNTGCFNQVKEPLHTGSYYENLKISNPDEFDIMFPIPVDRVDIHPFGDDGAFYIVSLKRGKSPLTRLQSTHLSASEILSEFRKEVIQSVQKIPGVEIDKKKKGCPAVTLTIEVDSRPISLDIVFCLAVHSRWPDFTNDGLKIERWLGRKVKNNYKFKPYYLVPKYVGKGNAECNGVPAKDAWRVSFSHVEKEILKNHGSEKTCCEKDGTRCCRKDCLKLLKHLLSLLKDQDKSFDKFCSYHAKTTLLHACCSRTKDSQWAAADLSQCFQQLLKDFEDNLKQSQLNNFFIPTQNLLSGCSKKSCTSLALRIGKEREEGFPIFN